MRTRRRYWRADGAKPEAKRAVFYGRVNTEEQVKNTSLAPQEVLNLATTARRRVDIVVLNGSVQGSEVSGARLALKTSATQDDEDTPLLPEVTHTATSSGQVTEGRDSEGALCCGSS